VISGNDIISLFNFFVWLQIKMEIWRHLINKLIKEGGRLIVGGFSALSWI